MRLDQFIARKLRLSERDARLRIVAGSTMLDQTVVKDHRTEIDRFAEIQYEDRVLQSSIEKLYLMFHKPKGILSATQDEDHRTVLDFIDCPDKESLHLAGRLDRSSTGMILLTNDGKWSESLTDPERKVRKRYLVETDRIIPDDAVRLFAEGFDFPTEGIRTRPASLTILAPCRARVTIEEGRYHQIKRMFHRIDGIRLVSLHRDQIGEIELPHDLAPGEWRRLSPEEIHSVKSQ